MSLRKHEMDCEVLNHAINDGINQFVREVLVVNGLVDEEAYMANSEIIELKHQICSDVAVRWSSSQIDDEA